MDSKFDFDAPQFLDLRERDTEADDEFFNRKMTEQEVSKRVVFADEKENVSGGKYSLGRRMQTPMAPKSIKVDRSNEAEALLEQIESLHIDSSKKSTPRKPLRATQIFEGITLLPLSEKKHKMKTRADSMTRTPLLKLRNRSIPKVIESEDETDDSMVSAVSSTTDVVHQEYTQNYNIKRSISCEMLDDFKPDQQARKFVALAEQIAKFHKETPDRFRTKPHQPWKPSMIKPLLYMAKAPRLSCVARSRPSNLPNQQEREQLEFEDMQKHQIKAKPVNAKILKEVSLGLKAPIEKRPTTCPQPFHLTEHHKPKPVEKEVVFQFKAQPAPTRILQSPVGIPPKKIIPATTPKTPAITLPVRVKAPTPKPRHDSGTSTDSLPRNTIVEPFSFEERDKIMKMRKEELIKKILEEEKKSFNSFKAQPIRKFSEKATPMKPRLEPKKPTTPMPFNLTKIKLAAEKKEEIPTVTFKANPAAVLNKRPFFPVYSAKNFDVQEFQLKTVNRAEERKKFDEKMQQAELEMKKQIEIAREETEKKFKEEVKELRKQAEFKANPIPRSRAFEIHASHASLTQPISPCFRSGKLGKKPSNLN